MAALLLALSGPTLAEVPADYLRSLDAAARHAGSAAFAGLLRRARRGLVQRAGTAPTGAAPPATPTTRSQAANIPRTGRSIAPLAPAANPERLTDVAKNREVVQAQLQRRAGTALHVGRGRRRHRLLDLPQTIGTDHVRRSQTKVALDGIVWTTAVVCIAMLVDTGTKAGVDRHRYPGEPTPLTNPSAAAATSPTRQRCSARPPGARSCEGSIEHFGTDASIGEARRTRSSRPTSKPGRGRPPPGEVPTLRISDAGWFRKEHAEIAVAAWKSPAVKSPANCGACHRQADRGDFGERSPERAEGGTKR